MPNIFGTGEETGDALDALAVQLDVQGGLASPRPVQSSAVLEPLPLAAIHQAAGSSGLPPWHDPYQQVVVYGAPSDPGGWPSAPAAPPGGWPTTLPAFPSVPRMDGPPPYADAEVAALATIAAALEGLDPIARKRVLRYLASKYGAAE